MANNTPIIRVVRDCEDPYVDTIYKKADGSFHREDGPTHIRVYDNKDYYENWYYESKAHRYGGPALIGITRDYTFHEFWIHGLEVTEEVETWLTDMGYVWGSMSEQEEWELDMFMRSLG